MNIGLNIKTRRMELGMTQRQLEEEAGLPLKSIYFYENGKRQIPTQYLEPLAVALKMSVDELVGIEKTQTPAQKLAADINVAVLKAMDRYLVELK